VDLDLRSGTPFWPKRDGIPYVYPSLDRSTTADVLVVGAGITGAAVAWELSTAGADVVVVDRRDVASGSSAASTGLLLYDTDASLAELRRLVGPDRAARVYQLGIDAIDRIERFCASRAQDCGFARRPSLYAASKRQHLPMLREELELRRRHGFNVAWLSGDELERGYRLQSPGAIYASGGAQVDPYRLTHELLDAARSAGARIFDRTAARGLRRLSNGVFTALTDRNHTVSAKSVVWATGYEAYPLTPAKARFASTWVIVTEPIPDSAHWPERCLYWETARPYFYLRTTEDGRVIAGGEDEPCLDCHRSEQWFRSKTTRLLERAQTMFSVPLEVAYAWAGTFSTTDDGLPFVGRARDDANVWLALGYGGNGITFSLMAGQFFKLAVAGRASADAQIFSRK
jgi:glycine/D-amino acid oxidase-like deaminating enzyme